jgi:hypothetical protein
MWQTLSFYWAGQLLVAEQDVLRQGQRQTKYQQSDSPLLIRNRRNSLEGISLPYALALAIALAGVEPSLGRLEAVGFRRLVELVGKGC